MYWITDESRFAMALSPNTFEDLPRLGGTNTWTGYQTFGDTSSGNVSVSGNLAVYGGTTLGDTYGDTTQIYGQLNVATGADSRVVVNSTTGASGLTLNIANATVGGLSCSAAIFTYNIVAGDHRFQVGGVTKATISATGIAVTGNVSVTDEAYGSSWNGSTNVPTKNAVYAQIEANKTGSFTFVIDGGGVAIAAGQTVDFPDFPFAANITGWTITSDASTTSVVTISKATYANFPTFTAISGTEKPSLTGAQKNQNLNPTTWTRALAQGDTLRASVDSNNSAKRLSITVRYTRT